MSSHRISLALTGFLLSVGGVSSIPPASAIVVIDNTNGGAVISNVGLTVSSDSFPDDSWIGASFATGSSQRGYTIDQFLLRFLSVPPESPEIQLNLYSAGSTGAPSALLASTNFTASSLFGYITLGTPALGDIATTVLSPSVNYALVAQISGSGSGAWAFSSSPPYSVSDDFVAIGTFRSVDQGATWVSRSESVLYQLSVTPVPAPAAPVALVPFAAVVRLRRKYLTSLRARAHSTRPTQV